MQVKDVMTANLACCTPETTLPDVARLMVDHDCGAIPVVENKQNKKPVGVVTDRDITTRAVARGQNPVEMTAGDVMTGDCCTIAADASLKECCEEMELNKIRRMIVTDGKNACCGIVSQADIALRGSTAQIGEVVREVSQPAAAGAA
jgi:CBS domain-containing protein